ncbi:MAG: hypothetical protein ABFS41_01685 [Myxococcota bacterium]
MRATGAACFLAVVLALGCGKYGPPVRAGEEPTSEPEPGLEIPGAPAAEDEGEP